MDIPKLTLPGRWTLPPQWLAGLSTGEIGAWPWNWKLRKLLEYAPGRKHIIGDHGKMAEPSNLQIFEELQRQRIMLEKLLAAVPGAVTSEATRQEERERQAWGLELAARSRRKSAG